MPPLPRTICIAQATAIAGVDHDGWRESVNRGAWRDASSTGPGQNRAFDPDDLICPMIFRELQALGVTQANAAGIAPDIPTVLRESPELDRVSVVKGRNAKGKPRPMVVLTPPAGDLVLMSFSIGRMHAAVDEALAGAQ